MWREIQEIYNKLQDEESKFIFKKRLEYNLCNEDVSPLWDIVKRYKDEEQQTILTLIQKKEEYAHRDIIIFGAGRWGQFYLGCLKKYQIGRGIVAFCDNQAHGMKEGIKILSVQEAVREFPDAVLYAVI